MALSRPTVSYTIIGTRSHGHVISPIGLYRSDCLITHWCFGAQQRGSLHSTTCAYTAALPSPSDRSPMEKSCVHTMVGVTLATACVLTFLHYRRSVESPPRPGPLSIMSPKNMGSCGSA